MSVGASWWHRRREKCIHKILKVVESDDKAIDKGTMLKVSSRVKTWQVGGRSHASATVDLDMQRW
jgi:hypothetical protein